jgi:beta-lactamase superfamily II metal-dependent hydrolase
VTTGFYIDMNNVGQGDAFLLTLGGPQRDATVLIDGGPRSGEEVVAQFVLANAGGHLDLVIGTHLDIDHIGGLENVVAASP